MTPTSTTDLTAPEVSPIAIGNGGEWHQSVTTDQPVLTTNQGLPIADNQNSLCANPKDR